MRKRLSVLLALVLAILATSCNLPDPIQIRGMSAQLRAMADQVDETAAAAEAAKAAADAAQSAAGNALGLGETSGLVAAALAVLHAWRNHTRRRDAPAAGPGPSANTRTP